MEREDHDMLVKVSTVVDEIYHRLFGNGNEGELDQIKGRTGSLEEFKNKVLGAVILLSCLLGILGGGFIWHLFGGSGK